MPPLPDVSAIGALLSTDGAQVVELVDGQQMKALAVAENALASGTVTGLRPWYRRLSDVALHFVRRF